MWVGRWVFDGVFGGLLDRLSSRLGVRVAIGANEYGILVERKENSRIPAHARHLTLTAAHQSHQFLLERMKHLERGIERVPEEAVVEAMGAVEEERAGEDEKGGGDEGKKEGCVAVMLLAGRWIWPWEWLTAMPRGAMCPTRNPGRFAPPTW